MTTKQFELKVLKFIKDNELFDSPDHLLVAVSGGPDSLCLLLLLAKWAKRWTWQIKVAYFDHGLRKAAKEEALFVAGWAKKCGFPFVSSKGNSLKKKKEGFSIEEAARNLRYDFLKKGAQKFNNAKIVVAHHVNDQIETFFIQLLKGSGLGGLSGMKAKTDSLIRPLLSVTKKEILEYLEHKKIQFKQDETNAQEIFLRNRVRLELIPFLKKHFSEWNIEKTLPKMMNVLKDEHEFLEHEVGAKAERTRGVPIETFKKLPPALQRRMIKNTLEKMTTMRNFTSSHVEESRKLFFNPASYKMLMLPEGIRVKKFKKAVFFRETL